MVKRRTKIVLAAVAAALVIVAAAVAATVSISSQTASATWLGLTQPVVTVAPPLAIPLQNGPGGNGVVTMTVGWGTVPNATAYRLWVDGVPIAVVKADPVVQEQRLLAMSCGRTHRFNAQGLNGKSVGPIAAAPVYFTIGGC